MKHDSIMEQAENIIDAINTHLEEDPNCQHCRRLLEMVFQK